MKNVLRDWRNFVRGRRTPIATNWRKQTPMSHRRPDYNIVQKSCRYGSTMKVKRSKSASPEPSSSQDCKRPKIEDAYTKEEVGTFNTNILDFSDDVLLDILKYLFPQDLLALSLCCKRLDRICRDRTLWRRIDFRHNPISMRDLRKCKKFLQASTTKFAVRGTLGPHLALQKGFLKAISDTCCNLKELIIEECNVNVHTIEISNFPTTLEKLSLKGCVLHNFCATKKSYLFRLNHHMPHLTCLILSHCSWLTPHSLMVLSKMPKLKELRLDSCPRFGECTAYASLATRFGFKTLEILDVRFTALGDSEVCCFSSTKTLTHMYLECPKSRNPEYCRRRSDAILQDIANPPIYEDPNLVQYVAEGDAASYEGERCPISDRTVCALGTTARPVPMVMNPLGHLIRYPENVRYEEDIRARGNLKCLVVRNYTLVTNQSLRHLAVNSSSLELLDVTGTSVTQEGVQAFKVARPNVKIITSFNEE